MLKIFIGKLLRKFGYKITTYESVPYNKKFLEVYEVLYEIIQILEKRSVKGAFVECGYGHGRSFAVLSHFADKSGRKIFGFDSFKGFPNVTPADYSSRNPKTGQWSVRTLKEANKFIKSLGIFPIQCF